MNKKRNIAVTFLFILLTVVIILPFGDSRRNYSFTVEDTQEITVENGVVTPDSATVAFGVEKDGRYRIAYGWMPEGADRSKLDDLPASDIHFLTVLRISDSNGRQVFGTCAPAIYADIVNQLPAGLYTAEFRYFADREAFAAYASEYLFSARETERLAREMDFDSCGGDGTVRLQYYLGMKPEGINPLFAVRLLLICALLTAIILLLTKDIRRSYDERQQLERGRACRLGFITTVIGIILAIFVDLMDILPSQIHSHILYGAALYAGLMVFVIYCIWHEAYFSLKEKPGSGMLLLGGAGAFNLLIALGTMLSKGSLMENGRLTYPAMNAVSALLMLVLLLFVGLKAFQLRKLAAAEAEDEEDEDDGGQGGVG